MTALAIERQDKSLTERRMLHGLAPSLGWLGLAIVGEIARLQLIDAGPLVSYQHYKKVGELFSEAPVATIIVALQGLLAIVGIARLWPRIRDWMGTAYPGWRAVAALALFAVFAATLSKSPVVFAVELVMAAIIQVIALATIVLAAAALPAGAVATITERVRRLLPEEEGNPRGGVDRFALVVAAWVTIACALLAVLSYQRHPHVPDEVSYIYQARYFAEGLLAMAPPPVQAAFDLDLMSYEPSRWYSPVPPGWPAVLALGYLAGIPWLVNPILNGLNVLLVYVIIRDMYGRRTARWAGILLATSPWFVFMGMNFMTHTLSLICTLLAALSVARLRRGGSIKWAVLGGIGIGIVSIIRPLEGLAVAMLLGLWALPARSKWFRFAPVAVMAVVSMIVGAAVLPYNKMITGSSTNFPIMAYNDVVHGEGSNDMGFGPRQGIGWPGLDPLPGHGPVDVVINAALNGFQLNVELLGWSFGSLLVIGLLLFSRRMRREDWWMVAATAVVAGLHSFYWFSGGPDFGARYWYLIIVPCIALASRGIETLEEMFASPGVPHPAISNRAPHAGSRDYRVTLSALALCAISVVVFMPWRAVDKYYHYRRMEPGVERLAGENSFGRSLVLVRGRRHPDYMSAGVYNPMDLQAARPVYVWDRSDSVRVAALEAYPDRPVWIVNGPTVSGDGFKIAAGPLSAVDAIAWKADTTEKASGGAK
ncbi:MAG: glycosyltransferase family 39 protein [Anaerolineae bacterium]|nr:glycosyltransferase family 39 protein [Gemmatimonadaceae bacterium]